LKLGDCNTTCTESPPLVSLPPAPLVVLTDKGKSTYEAALRLQAPWVNRLAEGLRLEDLETMRGTMAALHRKLEREVDAEEQA